MRTHVWYLWETLQPGTFYVRKNGTILLTGVNINISAEVFFCFSSYLSWKMSFEIENRWPLARKNLQDSWPCGHRYLNKDPPFSEYSGN